MHYFTRLLNNFFFRLKIHFIHVKGQDQKAKKTVPLLLLHGWPGSVREFYEFIPKLITANAQSGIQFTVVAPSLAGYGWSEGASIPGLGATEMSVIMRNLMVKLGYTKFLVQGGDWGSIIGSTLATLFPENVIGYHSNMCATLSEGSAIKGFIASFMPQFFIPEEFESFVFPLGEKFKSTIEESGYFHIQATKPDTIGKPGQLSQFQYLKIIVVFFLPRYCFITQSSRFSGLHFGKILNLDQSKLSFT